jgi:hypothetical protein
MESILELIAGIQGYITMTLIVIIILMLILVIVLFSSLSSLEKRYRRLTRGVNNKNIEELIVNYLEKVEESRKIAEDARELCNNLNNKVDQCIQKVAVLRYKAFENVGGDLSFSIALLDNNNYGVILTGIYGRDDSTTYAKPIEKGISRYDLSDEEQHVLNEAMNKSNLNI